MSTKTEVTISSNKQTKTQRHEKLVSKQLARKDTRLEMLSQVKAKFSGKKGGELRRMFGTLNIHRMTDILNDTFEFTEWYRNRLALQEAKETIPKVQSQVRYVRKFEKRRDKDRARRSRTEEIPEVSDGSNE